MTKHHNCDVLSLESYFIAGRIIAIIHKFSFIATFIAMTWNIIGQYSNLVEKLAK